jgi:hypothetical protein
VKSSRRPDNESLIMTDDQTHRILATLDRLEAGQEGLRTGQDRLRADLMERMDRLQHAVDLVRDDITVNYGSSDNALRIAKGASDEVRGLGEILTTMRRQITRLQTDVEQLRGGGAAA